MKTRILIFSSLICLCGGMSAQASDCVGTGCDIEPLTFEEFEWVHAQPAPQVMPAAQPTTLVVATPTNRQTWMESDPQIANLHIPMRNIDVKVLSIKPVPEDTRPALWDGVHGKYIGPDADKTVDWKDGVPIWDESINNYKYKDFSDWFLEASPEVYVRDVDTFETTSDVQHDPFALYQQNMEDAATTRARVEELLTPHRPSSSLWFSNQSTHDVNADAEIVESVQFTLPAPRPEYTAQDMSQVVSATFGTTITETIDDGCPFETETECEIWRRKPIVRETVSPRSAKLRATPLADFVHAADCNKHITANEVVSAPLLDRYKMLMRSAQACCTDGMAYALKQAGASDGLVYKFLSDDANFYGFGARCLMMTDHDLDSKYPNTATAVVAADVRNGCLCRGRQWFQAMLAPFEQVYNEIPEFKDALFNYTYKDGLNREITVSVNNDVQNVLKQLEQCP